MRKTTMILLMVLSLAVFTVNCGDFLTGGILDSDPNRADAVPLLSQFVALQAVGYGFYIGDVGVFPAIWMQQMAGTGHQYSDYEQYGLSSPDFGALFGQLYQEGGLIDLRPMKAQALAEDKLTLLGLTKMYEALMFSAGADVWGDIPYSEAARTDIPVSYTHLRAHET